jgi:hypothetical protein
MNIFNHPDSASAEFCGLAERRNSARTQPRACKSVSRNSEKGAGRIAAIIWTLILLSLIFVALKVTPVLVNNYQFRDGIENIARYASAVRQDVGKVREAVMKEAAKDDVPITAEQLKVVGSGGNYQISADYSVTIDLKVYQWTLNFHPAVSNNALVQ